MSTSSSISIKNKDGSINSIYCHWDGYLSNNGRILKTYYTSEDKVRKLLGLGDISSLGINPETAGPASWDLDYMMKFTLDGKDYLKCRSYADRGEDCPAQHYASVDGIPEQEYMYLYDNGIWYYRKYNTDWQLL